jgi:integrase
MRAHHSKGDSAHQLPTGKHRPDALTVLALEKAARGGKRQELADGQTRGLFAFVLADGRVTFGLRYVVDGERRRMKIGEWKAAPTSSGLTLQEARVRAGKLLAEGDPKARAKARAAARLAERERDVRTLERITEAWLKSREARAWREATRREIVRVVHREIQPALGAHDPNDPELRPRIVKLIRGIADGHPRRGATKHAPKRGRRPERSRPAPVMANRVLTIIRMCYRWALAEEQAALGVRVDATAGLRRPHVEDAVPRVYSPTEIRALFAAAKAIDELLDLVPLLAYTMARLGEGLGAEVQEVDFDEKVWTIPASRSKDGRPHVVPLNDPALELLKKRRDSPSGLFFPGRSIEISSTARRLWRQLSEVPDATLHAWRDTAAAALRELGYSTDVREDLLSHTPPRLHRAYQGEYRTSLAERRRAIDAWGEKLAQILAAGQGAAS